MMDLLADPRVRLGAGTAVLLATAMAARRDRVGPCETAAFRAVTDLLPQELLLYVGQPAVVG